MAELSPRDTTPHRLSVVSGEKMNQLADFENRKSPIGWDTLPLLFARSTPGKNAAPRLKPATPNRTRRQRSTNSLANITAMAT